LFCFVHKKTVCLSCILAHKNCVVKTYLDWLQNSDFDPPTCVCKGIIPPDNAIRLTCLDLFHPSCLDAHAATFPPHTAQAGYTCPTCSKSIIPTDLSTPLAKNLCDHLRNASWFQKLGGVNLLPALEVPKLDSPQPEGSLPDQSQENKAGADNVSTSLSANFNSNPSQSYIRKPPRSAFTPQTQDVDEDKYRKRTFYELFTSLGFIEGKRKNATDATTTTTSRSRRPNTRRMLVLFALLSTLATVFVLHLSLSSDSTTEQQ